MIRFNKLLDVNGDVLRNICSLKKSVDLFDDLHDDDPFSATVAIASENRVKQLIPPNQIARAFHYSTAINYPFETEPYLATRYSNGSHPAWYGSFDLKTSIYETAYHMLKAETAVEGLNEIIIRERAVYDVHCLAMLIDLTEQKKFYSALAHPTDYSFTQQIGQRVYQQGHPGLAVPSARHKAGNNVVIFNPNVLTNPRLKCYLTYHFNPMKEEIKIKRNSEKPWITIYSKSLLN